MAIRSELGPDGEAAAVVMDNHAARLKGTNPADFAFGAPFFNPALPVTPDRPAMSASIVHEVKNMDFPQHKMLSDLILDQQADGPQTFCVPEVSEVEPVGNVLLNAKCRLTFIGSRKDAIQAIQDGKDPTLDTGKYAALGVKFNMRELPKWTAVLNSAKAFHFCQDLIRYGKWAALCPITPREHDDAAVVCPFPVGFQFDMVPSICNIAVYVNEDFVKTHLCDGDSNYVYQHDPNTPMVQDKEGTNIALGEPPTLTYSAYQEITGNAYAFKTKTPINKPIKQYRVWFEGITASILEDTALLADASKGEKLVVDQAKALGLDMDDFFKQRCVIYVVATAAPSEAASSASSDA